jgi:hypothetical protein
MQTNAVVLASNLATTAPTVAAELNTGGRHNLTTTATTYPGTTCQLQVQHIDGTWVNLGSNITANGVTAFDLSAGQYRLNISGTASAALYATLVRVPY